MCNLLIIENDRKTSELIRTKLKSFSFTFNCTQSYESAIKLFDDYHPEIILMSSLINHQTCDDTIDYFYQHGNPLILLLVDKSNVEHTRNILLNRDEMIIFKSIDSDNFIETIYKIANNIKMDKVKTLEIAQLNEKLIRYKTHIERNIIAHIMSNSSSEDIHNDFQLINHPFAEGFFIVGKKSEYTTMKINEVKEVCSQNQLETIHSDYMFFDILFVFSSHYIHDTLYYKISNAIISLDANKPSLYYSSIITKESQLYIALRKLIDQCNHRIKPKLLEDDIEHHIFSLQKIEIDHYVQQILQYHLIGYHDYVFSYLEKITYIFNNFEHHKSKELFRLLIERTVDVFSYALHIEMPDYDITDDDKTLLHRNQSLIEFYRQITLCTPPLQQKTPSLQLKKVLSFIIDNFANSMISLDDASSQLHLSSNYICRILKKYTNFTFTDLLNSCRIEYAKGILKTDKKIKEIAGLTGFHSSTYFIRVFKKTTGISPLDYREDPFYSIL